MSSVMLRFDVAALDNEDVTKILDVLWEGKRKEVLEFLKDVALDYICPDCEMGRD